MATIQPNPQARITISHSGTNFTLDFIEATIRRIENGIDNATILLVDSNSDVYANKVSPGDNIQIEEKDASDTSWNKVLGSPTYPGCARAVEPQISNDGNMLRLEVDGSGYGMFMTSCIQEYGTESSHSTLDTIKQILENGTYGILPAYVNQILGSGSSGYNYAYDIETIPGTINYILFPYKPSNKSVDDLCDLVTAIKDGGAGPSWRFDPTHGFLLKTIGSVNAKWPQYFGGSQTASTLEEGKNFSEFQFQQLNSEANFVLYYGILRKPARDYWTELANPTTIWATNNMTITGEPTVKKVGAYSLKCDNTAAGAWARFPSLGGAGWDFTKIGTEQNIPTFNFWNYVDSMPGGQSAFIGLYTDGSKYYYHNVQGDPVDTWVHHSLTVGPFYRPEDWSVQGSPDWSNINYILIYHALALFDTITIWDDMHFEGLICRVARQKYPSEGGTLGNASNPLKIKVITDNIGKDDSMVQSNDTGTIARMTYMELLKAQTSPIIGTFVCPILPTLLPGELVHVHAKKTVTGDFSIDWDFRVTKVSHRLNKAAFLTSVEVTDDVTNSHPRSRLGDINKILASVRPEYQDRQATSIKASNIDLNIARLEVHYP